MFSLDRALDAAGELLARRQQTAAIVVVGGTGLNLLGIIERATRDVDVIAIATVQRHGEPGAIGPPDPLPAPLVDVVATVARDLGLPPDWLNATVGGQWKTGLPPGFAGRITWRRLGGLWVGLPDPIDFIYLKLYAAADDIGPASKHFKDLLALQPTAEELAAARVWIQGQDSSPAVAEALHRVIAHVRAEGR